MNFSIFDITGHLPIKNHYSEIQEPLNDVIEADRVEIQQYYPHDPITISSDSEFASQGFNGSGTIADPYQIEGLNIAASKSALIEIRHTKAYFTIRNNILNGMFKASSGIKLYNVLNGSIENNIIFNHESDGINLFLASYITITNNTITNNFNGINLGPGREGPRTYNSVTNNKINNNRLSGILSDRSRCNLLSNNIITENQQAGIWLTGSYESTLSANLIINNSLPGIYLSFSSISAISSNTILNNGYTGVHILGSRQVNVSSNTISSNGYEGLLFIDSSESRVLNNTVSTNYGYGVHLNEFTQNVTITGNNFLGNNQQGGSQARDEGQGNIFEANYWDDWSSIDLSYPIEGIVDYQDQISYSKSEDPFIVKTNVIFGLCVLIVIISALIVIIRKQVLYK